MISEEEVRRNELVRSGQHDEEIGLAVPVRVSLDEGVSARLEITKFPGNLRKAVTADEREGVVSPASDRIDQPEVDPVAFAVVEVADVVSC